MADLEETNQEFLIRTLQKLHDRLNALFNKFVEEQLRGIEDTKVKISKRKGVIAFMKIFPPFSAAIENMLPTSDSSVEHLEVRDIVNEAYVKINKAMWESLKFIAKESPGQPGTAPTSTGDPEDKEALNYNILHIENMNHYVEEVDIRQNLVLGEWRQKAERDMQEHMKLYLDAVVRRPLGKLLDFLESTESLMMTVSPPTNIATRASHSRSVFKKILSSQDAKEVRRGIETLKKRVEKHFGDADDPGLSRSLVVKVSRACEGRYNEVEDRVRNVIDQVYEGSLELDWKRSDVESAFRR